MWKPRVKTLLKDLSYGRLDTHPLRSELHGMCRKSLPLKHGKKTRLIGSADAEDFPP